MESINERIAYIVNVRVDGNTARFAELLGTSRQYVNKLIKEGGSVGIEPISKILKIFPEIDARWLILGEGSPFIRAVKEIEIRTGIELKLKTLTDLERYIPAMDEADLDKLSEALRSGMDPEIDSSKFTAWESVINDKKEILEQRVSEAMKKGICKTKKAKQ